MGRYLLGRVLQGVFVLWAAYTLSFAVLFALPGDPAAIMAGPTNSVTPEQLDRLRHELGLDRPVPVQYLDKLTDALQGDLGRSLQSGEPVTGLIGGALPPTAALAGTALVLGLVFGTGFAVLATVTRRNWLRHTLLSLPPLGVAVPSFVVGLLLLQWFAFSWNLFPAIGSDGWNSLVLPALTLSLQPAALIAQVLAKSMTEEQGRGYVDVARAKGAGPFRVNVRHVLRNAALPALTIAGLLTGGLLTGAIVVEVVFSRNGLGQVTQNAVSFEDLPVVQGVVLLGALVFVVVNLVVDVLYQVLDPRLGVERRPVPLAGRG
ncbi:ABC transporter permease [Amycolatopsis azurea]|uniref:Binding-protein-dependent transport systems inner membrane component n=1 Tax=Amycolatopsis azurea DSM 43854 TaxID=1238180 RepID=M2QTD3_9PSEU|nr:ABC transporter permease [Amycolatopsis azurea]EMD29272.1 Binding-protein-dependent transport systems inner membrane component [Amycolatopsis azurea DSM 43854]OOC01894.1 peptide ABC transporter permease [Amycolatopsis azurea DSM 43854]